MSTHTHSDSRSDLKLSHRDIMSGTDTFRQIIALLLLSSQHIIVEVGQPRRGEGDFGEVARRVEHHHRSTPPPPRPDRARPQPPAPWIYPELPGDREFFAGSKKRL